MKTQLVQHVSQLSVMLRAVPKIGRNPPRRIGFALNSRLEGRVGRRLGLTCRLPRLALSHALGGDGSRGQAEVAGRVLPDPVTAADESGIAGKRDTDRRDQNSPMADHSVTDHKHGSMDIRVQEKTFAGFVRMTSLVRGGHLRRPGLHGPGERLIGQRNDAPVPWPAGPDWALPPAAPTRRFDAAARGRCRALCRRAADLHHALHRDQRPQRIGRAFRASDQRVAACAVRSGRHLVSPRRADPARRPLRHDRRMVAFYLDYHARDTRDRKVPCDRADGLSSRRRWQS